MLKFLFNKEHKELALAEIKSVVGKCRVSKDFIVSDVIYNEKFNRLAFTKIIYDDEKKIVLNRINSFQNRRSHLLPEGHPAMTHPRLARAMREQWSILLTVRKYWIRFVVRVV